MTHRVSEAGSSGYKSIAEIETLVAAFEDGSLPRPEWTHAAHLTVAFWYLLQERDGEATGRIREGIQRYNAAHGILTTRDSGYHETLTLFWTAMLRHFLADGPDRADLPSLTNAMLHRCLDKNLPLQYYSRERLMSWEARSDWLEPDLKPLPEPGTLAA